MFVFKKSYYLFIENTRILNLNLIKIRKKFNIIYRNLKFKEQIKDLSDFRRSCKKNGIKFYIANDTILLTKLKADGLYISAHNKNLLLNRFAEKGFDIIGSAHNQKEINIKEKQGCKTVIFSRLFETNYSYKKGHLGVRKFNTIYLRSKLELVPLGGIDEKNLNKMSSIISESFACLSAIKKKPAKLINRLF
tara:strand:- start:302 stop:877 length:576 start_codon:yes stop_codon:yes gene_type:complete